MFWYIVIFCILVYFLFVTCRKEGLTVKPSSDQIEDFTNKILQNKHVFVGGSLNSARSAMPWVDAVIYEDVRRLVRNGSFTAAGIRGLFA